jgi:hypothetical protein
MYDTTDDGYGDSILTHMAVTLIKRAAESKATADEMFETNALGFATARTIAFGYPSRMVCENRKDALHNLFAAYYAV